MYVSGATFTKTGGTIGGASTSGLGNTAKTSGGGVYVHGGTFTMKGGTISENKATGGNGGGVYAVGTFTMTSGTVSGNTATSMGGGVYANGNDATFTKTGGTVYGDAPANTTTPQNSGSNANTATITINPGTNGHAVMLQKSSPTAYYYRNEDLTGADSISTTDTLPTDSGETAGNWTKR